MKFQVPTISSRAVFVGSTGSGKTTLARELLLRFYKNVIVYDVKGQMKADDWPGFLIVDSFENLVRLASERRDRKIVNRKLIYQPNIYELPDEKDSDGFADRFFKFIYFRENTVLYVDEIYGVCGNRNIPFHFKAILTRGRERGITCLMATQRPKEIPVFVLSESEFFYVFALQMPQDKKAVSEIKGFPVEAIEDLDKFEFLIATDRAFSTLKRRLKLGE